MDNRGAIQVQTLPLCVITIMQGSFGGIFLKCDVLDMEHPLVVSFSADVKGLSVVYGLLPSHLSEKYCSNVVPILVSVSVCAVQRCRRYCRSVSPHS